jgi:hypothetical protein
LPNAHFISISIIGIRVNRGEVCRKVSEMQRDILGDTVSIISKTCESPDRKQKPRSCNLLKLQLQCKMVEPPHGHAPACPPGRRPLGLSRA